MLDLCMYLTLRSTTSMTVAISCPAAAVAAAVEEDVDAEAGAGEAIFLPVQPGGGEGGNLARCVCVISSTVAIFTLTTTISFHNLLEGQSPHNFSTKS